MEMKHLKTSMAVSALVLAGLLRVAGMDIAEARDMNPRQQQSGGIVDNPSETRPGQIIQRAAAEKEVVVSDADDGRTVFAPVGGRLVVRLASNLTTGFQWRVVSGNPSHLRPDGEPTYETPDTRLMGAGGTQVFTFTVLDAIKTQLMLEYIRPWEETAIKRFTVIVESTPSRGP